MAAVWPTVAITDAMLRDADAYAGRVASTDTLRLTRNYTSLEAPGRYRLGYLGEAALASMLADSGARFDWSPRADGLGDGSDLTVYHGGLPYPCEVKTASRPWHKYLMQPVAQQRRRGDRGVVVGVRLNEGQRLAELAGYVSYRRFARALVVHPPDRGVRVPTRLVLLSSLSPISRLLCLLDSSVGSCSTQYTTTG